MRWFGKAHGAPYEADMPHAPTPVDALCGRCEERIGSRDDGLLVAHVDEAGMTHRAYHYACHMRGLIGGLNHVLGQCTCCGGNEPPDPSALSKREAARAAVQAWEARRTR